MDMNEQQLLHQLQTQHAQAVEDVLERHMLWCPVLVHPKIAMMGIIRTIIRLNDGRQCEVSSSLMSMSTLHTPWTRSEDMEWREPPPGSGITSTR